MKKYFALIGGLLLLLFFHLFLVLLLVFVLKLDFLRRLRDDHVSISYSNKTSFDFINMRSKILKNKEFVPAFSSENSEIFSEISSSLSNEEYECYGSCLCDQENSNLPRRNINGLNILSKSLYFVVSTISLSLAIKIASSHFSEECFNSLRNICSYDNTIADINYCESTTNKINSDLEISYEEEGEGEENESLAETGWRRQYYCFGHCVESGNLKREEAKLASRKFGCKNLKIEGRVEIVQPIKYRRKFHLVRSDLRAKDVFATKYLVPFCKECSKGVYTYYYLFPDGVRFQHREKKVILCSGTTTVGKHYRNWNIHCHVLPEKEKKLVNM